jgi:hypothetical protein
VRGVGHRQGVAGQQAGERYSYSSVLKFVSLACPSKDVLMLTITALRQATQFRMYYISVNLNRAGCMRSTQGQAVQNIFPGYFTLTGKA